MVSNRATHQLWPELFLKAWRIIEKLLLSSRLKHTSADTLVVFFRNFKNSIFVLQTLSFFIKIFDVQISKIFILVTKINQFVFNIDFAWVDFPTFSYRLQYTQYLEKFLKLASYEITVKI